MYFKGMQKMKMNLTKNKWCVIYIFIFDLIEVITTIVKLIDGNRRPMIVSQKCIQNNYRFTWRN